MHEQPAEKAPAKAVCSYCADSAGPVGHKRKECRNQPVCLFCKQHGREFNHDHLECEFKKKQK